MKAGSIVVVLAGTCLVTMAVWASPNSEDAVTALLRRQTDAGSRAGQKGDQATVQSFLDDQILFSAGDGTVQRDEKFDQHDELSKLLFNKTKAFQAANQRGDVAAMRRELDPGLLYVNEDGVVCGRQSFFAAAPAAVNGHQSDIVITDWVLHHIGDVAATSFVVEQSIHYDGQILTDKYLSVETWAKRGAQWLLMGSETIPLHQDPPDVSPSAGVLDDYVGTYTAGPGSERKISIDGDLLAISSNGAKAVDFKREASDVFYLPGQPTGYARQRYTFLRDGAGRVSGYMSSGVTYTRTSQEAASDASAKLTSPQLGELELRDFLVHHDGDIAVATFLHDRATPWYGQTLKQAYRSMETWVRHGATWKMITSQGRQMMSDDRAVTLPADALNDYPGTYTVGDSLRVTISRDGAYLTASVNGARPVALDPEARDVFFTHGAPRIRVIFQRDAAGHVTGYLRRREERDLLFTRTL